jgi:hypothetical protein
MAITLAMHQLLFSTVQFAAIDIAGVERSDRRRSSAQARNVQFYQREAREFEINN